MSSAPVEIAHPTGRCAATGRDLAPGDPIVVALVGREDDGALERLDFGADEWTTDRRRALGRRLFACWRTTQPEPSAKPKLFIDDESLVDLFHSLGDEIGEPEPPIANLPPEDRAQIAFRFVLALILCRKRLLKHEGAEAGDSRRAPAVLVRVRGAGPDAPLIRVVDPGMDTEALAAATERLGDVLRGAA